jgi:hypothetical protein
VQSISESARIKPQRDQRQHCNPVALQFQFLPPPSVAQCERALELCPEIIVTDFVCDQGLEFGARQELQCRPRDEQYRALVKSQDRLRDVDHFRLEDLSPFMVGEHVFERRELRTLVPVGP